MSRFLTISRLAHARFFRDNIELSIHLPSWRGLRSARLASGLSLDEASAGVCSASYLSLIETGKRPLTPKIWQGLAPVLGGRIGEDDFARSTAIYLSVQTSIRLSSAPNASTLSKLHPKLSDHLKRSIEFESQGAYSNALTEYRRIFELGNNCDASWYEICGGSYWAPQLYVLIGEQLVRLEADSNQLAVAIELAENIIANPNCSNATQELRALKGLLSGLFSEIGDMERAESILADLDRSGTSSSERALALWLRGQILMDNSKFMEGAFVLFRATEMLQDDAELATRLRLTNAALWAECLADTRLNAAGLQAIASAVSYFRETRNTPDLASCLNTMAFVAFRLGLIDLAEGCNDEALEMGDLVEGLRKASLLSGIALVFGSMDKSERALEQLRNARHTLEHGDYGRKSATIWAQMSEQYEKLGETTLSLACLKASLASLGISGSPLTVTRTRSTSQVN